MDAPTYLRQDHKSVLGMLQFLDGAPKGTGATMSGLATMVENLIIAESQHEGIEEQFFWPMVREKLDNGDELADHAVEQEQEGKKLLEILRNNAPGDVEYHEALQSFVKAGREHIRYEQEVVFPLVEARVGLAERHELGTKLETARKMAPTRPHPDTPPNSAVQKTMGTAAGVMDHVRDAVSGRSAENPPDPQH